MRISLLFCSLGGLLLASVAQAHENQPYLEFGLGHSIGTGELLHTGDNSAGMPRYGLGDSVVRSFAVGYQMINGLRLELDFRDRRLDVGDAQTIATRAQFAFIGAANENFQVDGTMDSRTRLLNVAYVGELIRPDWKAYLKLGAGEAKNRTRAAIDIQPTLSALGRTEPVDYPQGSDREFAWSLGTGVHMQLRENLVFGLDYQYTNLGDAVSLASEFGDLLEHDELAVHEVSIKLRIHFR